jgi:hypothetical protein
MALARRRQVPAWFTTPTRGASTPPCCSPSAAKAGIEVSMGSVGDCYDNAVCETSTPASRKSGSTGSRGQPAPRRAPRSSSTSKAGTTRGVGTPRSATSPRSSSSDSTPSSPSWRSRPRFPATDRSRRSHPGAQTGLQRVRLNGRRRLRCPRLDLSPERPRCSNRSRSGRDEPQSRDERHRVASPLGSQGPRSLIETSNYNSQDVSSKPGAVQSPRKRDLRVRV